MSNKKVSVFALEFILYEHECDNLYFLGVLNYENQSIDSYDCNRI